MDQQVPRGLAHYIRDLAKVWRADELTDADLLAAFAESQDGAAFAALVARHGRAVWAACRRVLGNDADAEDAFQATFICLARDARRLRRGALAGWLQTTAHRAALDTHKAARRRQAAHRRLCERVTTRTDDPPADEELRAAVQEELAKLPERLRVPLALYYLDGKSQAEVGRLLGITDRGVAGRLNRGLAVLRGRLARRGLAVTVAVLVATLGNVPPVVALPAGLVAAATETALAVAAGQPVAAPAASLALGVTRASGWAKARLFGLLVVASVTASAGAALCYQPGPPAAAQQPPPARLAATPPTPEKAPMPGPAVIDPAAEVRVVGVYYGAVPMSVRWVKQEWLPGWWCGLFGDRLPVPVRPGGHPVGSVSVKVGEVKTPVILVLTSYEPVVWHVNDPKGMVVKVVAGGYYEQTVLGLDKKVPVTSVTYDANGEDFFNAFRPDPGPNPVGREAQMAKREYDHLAGRVKALTGQEVKDFRGREWGYAFEVR